MSSTGGLASVAPFLWNAGLETKPLAWIISLPRNRVLSSPCCVRSVSSGKFERFGTILGTMFERSPLEKPIVVVAQMTKLCVWPRICWSLDVACEAEPSSPCP